MKRVHFIAIGGSAMHNLAMALHTSGAHVTGSDDEIFEPSRSRLAAAGLLPDTLGWDASRIDASLDMVVVGMHARQDNPELVRARELGLQVLSYPELIYQVSEHKQRIVVAGSHGKTTITSMIMHALSAQGRDIDYLVGARVEGFERSVRLTEEAPVIIIEGDEYPASPLDPAPKFLAYQHHIGVVSGIAWDHVNVYPDLHSYVRQFDAFADATPKAGALIYNAEDDIASVICLKEREDVQTIDYEPFEHVIEEGRTFIIHEGQRYPISVFGRHNLSNLAAAAAVCHLLSVSRAEFLTSMATYKGAANRLEALARLGPRQVYKDFAHAPSKVEATMKALAGQNPEAALYAVLELHTFSSLNQEFLAQYRGTLEGAVRALVYYSPKAVAHKRLPELSPEAVKAAFGGRPEIEVVTDPEQIEAWLNALPGGPASLLLMSSAQFGGLDLPSLARSFVEVPATV